MRQPVGIVDVLVSGEAAEHGLAQQPGQHVTGVLAPATVRQHAGGQVGQTQSVVQFAVGEQSGVGRDPAAAELQLQAPVEPDPQGAVVRFTRRVFHERTADLTVRH